MLAPASKPQAARVIYPRSRGCARSGRPALNEHILKASNMPFDPTDSLHRLRLERVPAGQRRRSATTHAPARTTAPVEQPIRDLALQCRGNDT
jgi:hypothetical protein